MSWIFFDSPWDSTQREFTVLGFGVAFVSCKYK